MFEIIHCEDCKWWKLYDEKNQTGACHYNAPIAVPYMEWGIYPKTSADGFCGEAVRKSLTVKVHPPEGEGELE